MFQNIKRIFYPYPRSNHFNLLNAKHEKSNSFPTHIACSLYSSGEGLKDHDTQLREDPKSNVGFRRMFKNKVILKNFLEDILKLSILDVSYEDTFPRSHMSSKDGVLDTLCVLDDGSIMPVMMQVLGEYDSKYKALFHACHKFSQPYLKGRKFSNLNPVCVISISDYMVFSTFPGTVISKCYSQHLLKADNYQILSQDLRLIFLELSNFKKDVSEIDKLQGNIELWSFFFKYASVLNKDEIEKLSIMKPCILQAIYLLNRASQDKELERVRLSYSPSIHNKLVKNSREIDELVEMVCSGAVCFSEPGFYKELVHETAPQCYQLLYAPYCSEPKTSLKTTNFVFLYTKQA